MSRKYLDDINIVPYYQNQEGWTHIEYKYLYLYLHKMIKHIHDTTGSIDGENRIEEIKKIEVDKLSNNTKNNVLYN